MQRPPISLARRAPPESSPTPWPTLPSPLYRPGTAILSANGHTVGKLAQPLNIAGAQFAAGHWFSAADNGHQRTFPAPAPQMGRLTYNDAPVDFVSFQHRHPTALLTQSTISFDGIEATGAIYLRDNGQLASGRLLAPAVVDGVLLAGNSQIHRIDASGRGTFTLAEDAMVIGARLPAGTHYNTVLPGECTAQIACGTTAHIGGFTATPYSLLHWDCIGTVFYFTPASAITIGGLAFAGGAPIAIQHGQPTAGMLAQDTVIDNQRFTVGTYVTRERNDVNGAISATNPPPHTRRTQAPYDFGPACP